MKTQTTFPVRYAETDQMGIVHHSAYVPWLEMGRVDWLLAMGDSYAELEKSGIFFPVIAIAISYRAPAHFGEMITVETSLAGLKSRWLQFSYQVLGPGGLLASATSEHITQGQNGRATRLPGELQQRLQKSLDSPDLNSLTSV